MRRLLLPVVIAATALGSGASGARALTNLTDSDATCPNVFSVCVDFTLSYDASASKWTLLTDYLSSPSGLLTATGIYYNAGKTAPTFGIGNVTLVPSTLTGWQAGTGCSDLNLNNGSTDLLGACESTTNGINDALAAPGTLKITFTANSAFWTAVNSNQIDYRAHIQGYGVTTCSIKLDTGVQGNIGSSGSDCTPSTTTPEPASMVLLATGLLGVGLPVIRRRRRQELV